MGPVGSFSLRGGEEVRGADDFTTDHAVSQGLSQLPSSRSLVYLSVSESTELVSLPCCKHTTEQGNNEASYLEKTCFPAECHYMSLSVHLNSPFLQLATRKTGERDDCEIASLKGVIHVLTEKKSPPESQVSKQAEVEAMAKVQVVRTI